MPHDPVLTALLDSHSRALESIEESLNKNWCPPSKTALNIGRLEKALVLLNCQDFKEHPKMQLLAELIDTHNTSYDITAIEDLDILSWYLELAPSLDYKSLHYILSKDLRPYDKCRPVTTLAHRGPNVLAADPKAEAYLQERIFELATECPHPRADLQHLFSFRFTGQSLVSKKLLDSLLAHPHKNSETFVRYLISIKDLSTADRLALLPILKSLDLGFLVQALWFLEGLQLPVRQAIAAERYFARQIPWSDTLQNERIMADLEGQYLLFQQLLIAKGHTLASYLGLWEDGTDMLREPSSAHPALVVSALMGLTSPAKNQSLKAILLFLRRGQRLLQNLDIIPPKELINQLLNSPYKEVREQGIKFLGEGASASSTVHLGQSPVPETKVTPAPKSLGR